MACHLLLFPFALSSSITNTTFDASCDGSPEPPCVPCSGGLSQLFHVFVEVVVHVVMNAVVYGRVGGFVLQFFAAVVCIVVDVLLYGVVDCSREGRWFAISLGGDVGPRGFYE